MRRLPLVTALFLLVEPSWLAAQERSVSKRGFLGRLLHPFTSSEKIPEYRNPKLRGLQLVVLLPPEPIKLAEMRQLPVTVHLMNRGDHAAELSFPTDQRIEILLRDAAGRVVTRWSDNRAFQPTPATILVNPNEQLEYAETIATRELSPGRVFTVEVLVPAYPELDTQRKSIAAP